MKTIRPFILCITGALCCAFQVQAGPVSLSRYALIIGSNTGNEERVELKYAISDAQSFARVMTELGGVSADRCLLLKNPDRKAFLSGLDRLKGLIKNDRAVKGRKEVVIYYSGHADENGILLGREDFSYRNIRDSLHDIGVDVRIAVLDACASGSLTREKGGTHRQPFLYDVSTVMEGYAFLTSSSADEASQESDAIQSSFFTHYLVSGLRGPADANSDGKVTLNEAYEFAYDETLQRTEKTKAGPQHAAYDIRLKGSGDLVLTDLRTGGAVLRLSPPITGRVFVHDLQGHLLVELYKTAGKKLEIGLEPGTFEVLVHSPEGVSAGTVTLKDGGVAEVNGSMLQEVKQIKNRLRGGDPATSVHYITVPVNLSLLPQLSLSHRSDKTTVYASLSLLAGRTEILHGVEISSGISVVTEKMSGLQLTSVAAIAGDVAGLQVSGAANLAGGKMDGLQLCGAVNLAGGTVNGLQVTSVLNRSDGPATGVQLSGAVNCAMTGLTGLQIASSANYLKGDLNGLQLSGAANIATGDCAGLQTASAANNVGGVLKGLQISGAYSHVCGTVTGGQLASALNLARGSVTGLQIAGGINIAPVKFTGLELAGGANITGKTTGLQVAGIVNLARKFTGMQLAPVNVCRKMTGFQLGVINICDTVVGVPMAVFSYVRKIPPRYRVSIDESGFVAAGVRSGGDYFYSLLSLGTSTVTMSNRYQWFTGAGFGARLPVKTGYVAVESMAHQVHVGRIWDNLPVFHVRNSLLYCQRFSPGFSLWAGPSLNIAVSWKGGKERNAFWYVNYERHLHHWHAYWPGITGGIEL